MKTLAKMIAEVREVNTALGWRNVVHPWGDYVALIHSEISEMLEAFRDHRLADATDPRYTYGRAGDTGIPKPEGVGSEAADVLIRILDHTDAAGISLLDSSEAADPGLLTLDRVPWRSPDGPIASFGGWSAWLHTQCALMYMVPVHRPGWSEAGQAWNLLRSLVWFCHKHGIDLQAEYERKMAYNRTRPYLHGGRTMSDAEGAPQ